MSKKEMVAERYSPVGEIAFGRVPAVCYHDGVIWTAVQKEKDGVTTILVHGNDDRKIVVKEIECPGNPYAPKIISANDKLLLTWVETTDNNWTIVYCSIDINSMQIMDREIVRSSDMMLDTPSISSCDDIIYIAWAARNENNIQIEISCQTDNKWLQHETISEPAVDSFRPDISACRAGVFVVFDSYKNNNYQVSFGKIEDCLFKAIKVFSDPGKRQLTAKIISSEHTVYFTWISLKEVEDNRAIRDHAVFAHCAEYKDGKLKMLQDVSNKDDANIALDLREGLLARYLYCGFYGLRRNPWLSLDSNNDLWIFWEVMFEDDYQPKNGHLMGRMLSEEGSWGEQKEFFSGTYAYAVADNFDDNKIAVACFDQKREELEILRSYFISLCSGEKYSNDAECWKQWKVAAVKKPEKSRKRMGVGCRKYAMYWADTHCHSVLSPDAEGEADELVHFARDIAGLDALCILDNDHYTYKGLSLTEWRKHQQLSEHYTREGQFVLFPGFEFTAKKGKYTNHRTVFYPRSGGKLLRCNDAECSTDEKLVDALKKSGALVAIHHAAYKILDPQIEKNVEIISSWRVCMAECDFTMKQLMAGEKFGFMGSSDAHRANSGLGCAWTGVYAEELTPESMAEAYNERRIIATQGFPIYIDFRAGDGFIGQEVKTDSESINIYMNVEAPEKIEKIKLIKDGKCFKEYLPQSDNFESELIDLVDDSEHFYFLEIKLTGTPGYNVDPKENSYTTFARDGDYPHNLCPARGVFAWTSPIWIKK